MTRMAVGLDIGYSNLKVAIGKNGATETHAYPASAALAGSQTRLGLRGKSTGFQVLVDGVQYVAGADPETLSDYTRVVHEDYASSVQYKALFHAALVASGASVVEHLVIGLPVWQFDDLKIVDSLQKQLTGEHQVAAKVKIKVEKVSVVPQPFGAFLDAVSGLNQDDPIYESTVLVVDPGFYSVDWVVIDKGQFKKDRSGSSMQASSVVIERIMELIREDYGQSPARERIENALREGKTRVVVSGEYREIGDYVAQASGEISANIVDSIREMLRDRSVAIDAVIMAGGGSGFYDKAIRTAFPKARFLESLDPVLANARGFLLAAG